MVRGGGEHDWGAIIAPTFDGLMARRFPGIFPHVGLSVGGKVMGGPSIHDGVVYPGISAIARNRQLPYQATPLAAYKELFSVAATSEKDLFRLRRSCTNASRACLGRAARQPHPVTSTGWGRDTNSINRRPIGVRSLSRLRHRTHVTKQPTHPLDRWG